MIYSHNNRFNKVKYGGSGEDDDKEQNTKNQADANTQYNDPIFFYWLAVNDGIPKAINSVEQKYGVKLKLDLLSVKPDNNSGNDNEQLRRVYQQQLQNEIAQERTRIRVETLDVNPESQKYSQLVTKLRQNYQKNEAMLINPLKDAKSIKEVLEKHGLYALQSDYDNYYSFQSHIYLVAQRERTEAAVSLLTREGEPDLDMKESIIENADRLDHKIQDLEITSLLKEFEGVELWNCTYKSIPHTYMKCSKESDWIQGLNKNLLHTCHPKTVQNLPLLPPLFLLKPNKEHVNTLINFLDTLKVKYPTHFPTTNSIFQDENGRLCIFTRQSWMVNRGWLAYCVAYGQISYQGYMRWVKHNGQDFVAKYHETLNNPYSDL